MAYTAEVLAPLFVAAVFMVFYELIERYDERRRAEGLRSWEERVNAEYREAALEALKMYALTSAVASGNAPDTRSALRKSDMFAGRTGRSVGGGR